jgi:hypothetical protein
MLPPLRKVAEETSWLSIDLKIEPKHRAGKVTIQTPGKYLFLALLVSFSFTGGRPAERLDASARSRPPAPFPPGIMKRCGDPTERMCYPGELSDNDLRWFCMEGRVTAELMRGRGFGAQDGANEHCELSQGEQRMLLLP